MDEQLKHRLVGAAVLVTAAVVIVPMILGRSGDEEPSPAAPRDDAARVVPLDAARPSKPIADALEDEPEPERAPAPPTTPADARADGDAPHAAPADVEPRFAVQLGSFAEEKNATALRDRLLSKGYRAYVETARGGATSTTRVLVGPQSDRAEAEKMLRRLRGETKLEGMVVRFRG